MISDLKESYKEYLTRFKSPRQLRFFLEFIETGCLTSSYMHAYNKSEDPNAPNFMSKRVACILGRRVLDKSGFSIEDYLQAMGHGNDQIVTALDKLLEKNPDKYLTHIETLRKIGLSSLAVQLGEGVQINIVSTKKSRIDEA